MFNPLKFEQTLKCIDKCCPKELMLIGSLYLIFFSEIIMEIWNVMELKFLLLAITCTAYPIIYAYGFVVLYFVVVIL